MIRAKSAIPEFAAEWLPHEPDVIAANPRIGWIQHVVVCDAQGQPKYDQPMLTTHISPVCLVVDAQGQIALLHHHREVIAPLDGPAESPVKDFSVLGNISLEFPRGGVNAGESPADAARREVEEEVGLSVRSVTFLDYVNGDTAFFPYANQVFLVEVDRGARSDRHADQFESIHVEFVTLDRLLQLIRARQLTCGLTKSAVASYVALRVAQGWRLGPVDCPAAS